MDNYDITADGIADLLVGRDDGLMEVYGYDESDEPVLRFSQVCLRKVCSLFPRAPRPHREKPKPQSVNNNIKVIYIYSARIYQTSYSRR